MAKDLKYFMREHKEEIIKAPGPDSFKDENGNVLEFEIRVLDNATIQKINDSYRKRTIATDKKGQPYIANGEVVFKVEKDNARATRHIIAEALVYPDLKDADLMKYYDCYDFTEMPNKVFPKAEEFAHVSRLVLAALGLGTMPDAEEDGEEVDSEINDAKN